jgi:Tfp pilus assembly protein PilF
MATFFENKERKVVPNWRRFDKTVASGELNNSSSKAKQLFNNSFTSIENYIDEWKLNKTIYHASDLVGAALVNSSETNEFVMEAAEYILSNDSSTLAQRAISDKILAKEQTPISNIISNLDDFIRTSNHEVIYEKVKYLKNLTIEFPHDFINHVELARLYSITGHKDKAMSRMAIAIHLAKDNRYVLRSASRLFTHYQDFDKAHDILRRNPNTKFDPWLLAAEISVASLKNKFSNNIKRGQDLIKSNNYTLNSISELASSLATLELQNGTLKASRAFFIQSLKSPNANSLAQAEWSNTKKNMLGLDIDPTKFEVIYNYEALAIDYTRKRDWVNALQNIEKWFLDMPFSKRAVLMGTRIANHYILDHHLSSKFSRAGLVSHPNDALLSNNLAYSLACLNKTDEAQSFINRPLTNHSEATDICITATKGLIFFRKGFWDTGRLYYREAYQKAKETNFDVLANLAAINYAHEELLIKSPEVDKAMEVVLAIKHDLNHPEITISKLRLEEQYYKYKQTSS